MSDDDRDELERGIEAQRLATLERLRRSPPPEREAALDDDTARTITDVGAIVSAERELSARLGRRPTTEELAARTGLTAQRVAQVTNVAPPPMVLLDDGE